MNPKEDLPEPESLRLQEEGKKHRRALLVSSGAGIFLAVSEAQTFSAGSILVIEGLGREASLVALWVVTLFFLLSFLPEIQDPRHAWIDFLKKNREQRKKEIDEKLPSGFVELREAAQRGRGLCKPTEESREARRIWGRRRSEDLADLASCRRT